MADLRSLISGPACPKCGLDGHTQPTPDGLAGESWIDGRTLWCAACGHAWDGTDAEIVAALTVELELEARRG